MRRLLLVLPVLLALLGAPALTAPAAAAPPVAGQSAYVPVEPVRLLDTRETHSPLGDGGFVDVVVAGAAGVPVGATAVVLGVTAVGATRSSDVRAYPTPSGGEPLPLASNLNAVPGTVVSNLVTVAVGHGGAVRLRNAAGSLHLLADLQGYYAEGPGSSYAPVEPRRLLDTRESGGGGRLGPGEARTLRVAGTQQGAPVGATAVALNVTAVGATRQTDIRVYPTRPGSPPPTVSSTNPAPGRATAVAVLATVGQDGSVDLRNAAGEVHLVVDLAGWFLPGGPGDQPAAVFHPLAPYRALDTRLATEALGYPHPAGPVPPTRVGPGGVRDVVVAGAGSVPPSATGVVLNVTAVGASAPTDVRVFPTPVGDALPLASNLNPTRGQTVSNAVLARTGRDGAVRLRNSAGDVHLVVDVAGWYGPAGDGWDVSWPQCTSQGARTSRLPSGGAFAVVGLTRRVPFTDNECFAAQWAWASSLPGEPSVYLNTNAPGPTDTPDGRHWRDPGPSSCSGAASDAGCGFNYGWNLAGYALDRLPAAPSGGRPMVWLDVEGPYANGPFWQTGYAGAVAVNRAVVDGARARLRGDGVRVGIYSDRATSPAPDWRQIMGDYRLPTVQNWVFRAPTADPRPLCTPADSFSGGPVVMVQVQPGQSGQAFDVNHAC